MPILPSNRHRYPPTWNENSRRIRFQRAEGRCECTGQCGLHQGRRCTERHGEPAVYARGKVVLTVAHYPDHSPENCTWDPNLWKPWACACGWRGPYGNVCPDCGGSGGLVIPPAPENNLLSLCQRCHLRVDVDHHRESVRARRQAGQEKLPW